MASEARSARARIEGLDAVIDEAEKRGTPPGTSLTFSHLPSMRQMPRCSRSREAYWLSEAWRRRISGDFPYYGRGLIQITWKENYKKAGDEA